MDLQGPLDDFYARTSQIRLAIGSMEALVRTGGLTSKRPKIDLAKVTGRTENTVNAMSMVFLASSFEEFTREEIGQCADHLAVKFGGLNVELRNSIRANYWAVWLDRVRGQQTIMTGKKKKAVDNGALNKVRMMLSSADGFVIREDAAFIERDNVTYHQRNFRPHVVDEIARRLGLDNFMDSVADSTQLRNHFGTNKKAEVAEKLRAKLDDFYRRRNEIVHSLSASTGYGADIVLDFIELFEATAESMKSTLTKATNGW
jgi:hypothetical protein